MNIFNKLLNHYKTPPREPLYLKMIDYAVEDNMTIIDIGSDDGYETAYILKKYPNISKIHLVEPDTKNIDNIKLNLRKGSNQKVVLYNLAISDNDYIGDFFISKTKSNLNASFKLDDSFNKIQVEYLSLDSFISQNNILSPILIMMDIEGQEVEVLHGLSKIIDKLKNVKILMEVHPHTYTDEHSLEKILSVYFNSGFKPTRVESAGCPDPEKFTENNMYPSIIEGKRALYDNPTFNFVLKYACHPHDNPIDYEPWVTKKIVRSLLIEKNR